MKGHTDVAALDAMLKLRVEPELKEKLDGLAKRSRKATAQLLREKLWQIVEDDEKRGGQADLHLPVSNGAAR
jgi:predicted DNA-binding protein